IPCCPPAADVIERCKTACDVEWLAEAGGYGRAEADVARHHAQGGQQRRGLEAIDERRVISRVHDDGIGDEEQIEFPPLGDLRDGCHHRQAGAGRERAVVAPSGRVVPGAEHEHPEMHLALGRGHVDDLPLAIGATRTSADHCSNRMFFSRTIVAHFCNSDWTLLARISGLPPTVSTPSFSSASLTLCELRTVFTLPFK